MAEEYQAKAQSKLDEAKKIVAEEENPWDQETKLRKLAEEKMKAMESVGGTKSTVDTSDIDDWSDNDEDEHQQGKKYNNLAQKF
mmetsp:Transcript_14723/g.20853  ORF Transcript_14723/g.20853 Transcript_14723/m.20853 type:complete len:84 (-) Transcript_14723:63-314(-)|eukprot:CAMPEP_0175100642 /NCGR_PEP_ID=MMETSP0086_2-20121207/7249_1 /TAXON_ID=136419 /ORGANISM="Unknown Unknown, Strain D1" /LENGTH=83 /DNA_ID=CAMNT_0016374873 /DNA_START=43 /DNA_END=294 /DNA_ORIENTATION=+